MSPVDTHTGLRWTTVDQGHRDGLLDQGLKVAHRLGWGRMHRMSIAHVRKHLGPLPQPLRRLAYGPTVSVPVDNLQLPTRDGSVPARVYRGGIHPRAPLVVFLHGGGFVAGDLDSHDHVCRTLAVAANAVVVAIHYRRAPEHPYPAAVHDCADAIVALADRAADLGVCLDRVCITGDSAGGNLSVAAALYLHDHQQGPKVARLLLVYPASDISMSGASMDSNAAGALLCAEDVRHFHHQYFTGVDTTEPPRYFSFIHAPTLAGLPPCSIAVAGRDPIRDDGVSLAHKLVHDGVEVEVCEYPSAYHGYWLLPGVSHAARHTTAWFAERIRESRSTDAN